MTKAKALKKFIKIYFGLDVDGNSPLSVLTSRCSFSYWSEWKFFLKALSLRR